MSADMEKVLVKVRVAPTDCWACGAETNIVSSVELSLGDAREECSIVDFTDYEHLVPMIVSHLPSDAGAGTLKSRRSNTLDKSYISNGCRHCDAIYGQHYEIHTRYDEATVAEFLAQASDGWAEMLQAIAASEDGHLFRAFD
jgi:competence protein CoiA